MKPFTFPPRGRLTLGVGSIFAAVVGLESYVRIHALERRLERDARGPAAAAQIEALAAHHRQVTLWLGVPAAIVLTATVDLLVRRLERLHTAQQQRTADIAHQIGTPLNLISGYVQIMREETRPDPATLQRLQIIETQIQKVTDATRTLIDAARPRIGQRRLVDAAALVEHVGEVSRAALAMAKVELRLDVRRPLPPLVGDRVQLELALFNLVSNSLDAMPDGGRLEIRATTTTNGVRLVVADSGTGIPPQVLRRVFEPWITTKPAGRGTGLGLSITRDTIGRHGGTIEVRSGPGRGTVVTIDLPAADAPGAQSPRSTPNRSAIR